MPAPGATLKEKLSTPTLRSGNGKQTLAQHSSNPSYGFGSAIREDSLKMAGGTEMDRAMCKSTGGNQSQGPIYNLRGSCGKQVDKTSNPIYSFGYEKRRGMVTANNNKGVGPGSYNQVPACGKQTLSTRPTLGRTHFGSCTRDIQEKIYIAKEYNKGYLGHDSPGPTAYKQHGSMGKMLTSDKPSNPMWGQGTEKRFENIHTKEAAGLPGVGEYKYMPSCGKQVSSTKPTKAIIGFGSSSRSDREKVYMNKEAEASTGGKDSPGPATARPVNAYGRQILATKKSNPSWGWGTADRFAYMRKKDGPGPGEYFA